MRAPLTFEAAGRADILAIVERAGAATGLKPDDAAATLVGLKLLAGVMLKEKQNPLFDPLREGVRAFVMGLKTRRGQQTRAALSPAPPGRRAAILLWEAPPSAPPRRRRGPSGRRGMDRR